MHASSCHVPIEAELSFLRQPGSYPEPTRRVQAVETHMSWVFLTDDFAYKLKKPVHFGPIDARLLSMRHFYCTEEVRLNRRLAAPVYLGAVPLVLGPDGHLAILGEGATVDWLVKMKRLAHEAMLDDAIAARRARPADMARMAVLLARFHECAWRPPLGADDFTGRIHRDIASHGEELLKRAYGMPAARVRSAVARQLDLLARFGPEIAARVRAGCVVEGHGDLRAEHVYVGEPPAFIDCIEFSRPLRTLDRLDEAGFLALECERLGAPELGEAFLDSYGREIGDDTRGALRHFYQSVRAATRATIAIRHLEEERFRYSRHWQQRALDYLALAERHLPG